MKTELRRFRVLPGHADLVDEWMHFLTSKIVFDYKDPTQQDARVSLINVPADDSTHWKSI